MQNRVEGVDQPYLDCVQCDAGGRESVGVQRGQKKRNESEYAKTEHTLGHRVVRHRIRLDGGHLITF